MRRRLIKPALVLLAAAGAALSVGGNPFHSTPAARSSLLPPCETNESAKPSAIEVPEFEFPQIGVPTLPDIPEIPEFDLEGIGDNLCIPEFELPTIGLPDTPELPDFELPEGPDEPELPEFELPTIDVPELPDFPTIDFDWENPFEEDNTAIVSK